MASDALEAHFGTPSQKDLEDHTAEQLIRLGAVDAVFDRVAGNYDVPDEYLASARKNKDVQWQVANIMAQNHGNPRGLLDVLRIEAIIKESGQGYAKATAAVTSRSIGEILQGTATA